MTRLVWLDIAFNQAGWRFLFLPGDAQVISSLLLLPSRQRRNRRQDRHLSTCRQWPSVDLSLRGRNRAHFHFSMSSQYSLSIVTANQILTRIHPSAHCFHYIFLIFLLLFPPIFLISWLDSLISQTDLTNVAIFFALQVLQIETTIGELTTTFFINFRFMWSLLLFIENGLTFSIFVHTFNQNFCGDVSFIFEPEQMLGFVAEMQASSRLLKEYKLGRIFWYSYQNQMIKNLHLPNFLFPFQFFKWLIVHFL